MEKLIQVVMIGMVGWLVYFACSALNQKKLASLVIAVTILTCIMHGMTLIRNALEAVKSWWIF
jgi:uncharacterized membrane protein YjjB (DUF3815 family)